MFGWLNQRYAEFRRWNTDQTQVVYLLPDDSRDYLDEISRKEVVRRVEWLLQSFPMVKEGGRGMARHAIGKGLTLQLNTPNLKWNAAAEEDFGQYALTPGRFDIAGRRDLFDYQHTFVEQFVWRGEAFASAARNPRWMNTMPDGTEQGEPCWQFWDSNEVESPDAPEIDIENRRIFDGVELDQFNNPVGYYVKAAGSKKHVFIPAADMVHWYKPLGINQVRGESEWAPAVKRLVHWHDLEALFIQQAKTNASLAITVKKLARVGGRGIHSKIRNKAAEATGQTTGPTVDTEALEKAFKGRVAYLGADGEAEVISPNSPGEKLEPFLSNLVSPNIFAAIGMPKEFFWDPSSLNSANQRFIIARADLTFQVLSDSLVYRFCNAAAYRYLQHRIAIGRLEKPPVENWAATMTWQTPARTSSIDNGRDAKSAIELVQQGMDNLRNWFDRNGKSWRSETRQWIREWLEFETMAKEEKATPDQIKELMMRWRPLMPGAG
ncbi:MAG TPA: phage portal protein, partial [Chthoniobacterales bacterium]|nr:phage portal protein [Chthoniobacterales bacterium]